jgi:hypothetical protein
LTLKKLPNSSSPWVIKSFGVPLKRTPKDAVEVLYGTEQLTKGELTPSMKGVATKRCFVVERLPASPYGQTYTRSDQKVKKNLLKLEPSEYFERSSDPKFGLRERAALQTLKSTLYNIQDLKSSALLGLRIGMKSDGLHLLHRLLQSIKRRKRWSLYDHLISRYILWNIGEIKQAKLVLAAIGLEPCDLRHALRVTVARTRFPRARCFVLDESYQTSQNQLC